MLKLPNSAFKKSGNKIKVVHATLTLFPSAFAYETV